MTCNIPVQILISFAINIVVFSIPLIFFLGGIIMINADSGKTNMGMVKALMLTLSACLISLISIPFVLNKLGCSYGGVITSVVIALVLAVSSTLVGFKIADDYDKKEREKNKTG